VSNHVEGEKRVNSESKKGVTHLTVFSKRGESSKWKRGKNEIGSAFLLGTGVRIGTLAEPAVKPGSSGSFSMTRNVLLQIEDDRLQEKPPGFGREGGGGGGDLVSCQIGKRKNTKGDRKTDSIPINQRAAKEIH